MIVAAQLAIKTYKIIQQLPVDLPLSKTLNWNHIHLTSAKKFRLHISLTIGSYLKHAECTENNSSKHHIYNS